MASSSSNSENLPSQSYTKMATADVDAIGAHCQMAFCNMLDFLPFRCESCRGTYCLDHRTENAHKCPKEGEWARRQREQSTPSNYVPTHKPNLLNHEQQCANPKCKTLINTPLVTGVHCTTCNRHYCLKHRFKEEHDCSNLKPLGARPQGVIEAQRERGLAAFAKLKLWGENKRAEAAKTSSTIRTKTQSKSARTAAQRTADMNKLKASAKGEASVPQAKRIYVYVEASADTTTAKYPTGQFFYNEEWSIGRVLDAAAKALQVQNINNRSEKEDDKLRIFHVEGGRLLEFSEKLGTSCKSGNTIVLLRGVGPAVPDLIEA